MEVTNTYSQYKTNEKKFLEKRSEGEALIMREAKVSLFELILENTVFLLAISLLVVMFTTILNRYLLHGSMAWSTEVLKFLFIWLNFLGASLGVKRGSHIGVKLLYEIIPSKRIRIFLSIISSTLVIVVLFTLVAASLVLIERIASFGQVTTYLALPYIYWYLAIPVGYCLMIFFFTAKSLVELKGAKGYAARD